MNLLDKIYSFRMRIALVLVFTLVITTIVLYKFNQQTERFIIEDVKKQRSELADAINVAQQSLTSTQYVREFLKKERSRDARETHIERILVVGSDGNIEDSSAADDINKKFDELGYGPFSQAIDLSHEHNDNKAGLIRNLIYAFPILTKSETTNETSRIFIIIVFSDDLAFHLQETSRNRLLATSGMLFISILVALTLIIEFTRPMGKLIRAAKQVEGGHFDVHLPIKRRDEFGQLMAVFNDMVKGLRERRELEARLYRAEQSAIVGRLASGIAHEIKNPLNYISLTIDYLRGKYAPEAEVARERFFEKMDNIKDEIKRLDRLIRNFLTYGRPLELKLKPINLRDLLKNILAVTSEQVEHQSINLILDQKTAIPNVEADVEQLRSCFSNLILNAQQVMLDGGELRIEFSNRDGGVEVTIADTGSGIAPENIVKIFEPYFSTKETGTGLGLALVKRIIESHGGRISVDSEPGRGTEFRVWLPLQPPQSGQATDNLHLGKLESLPAI